ncbi:FecR family protein [Arachidicoccus sp.]|uniref:FecR family protein n=1 Tax=Arachidicoccus sp. TaxID=1872624 RepID=UPI003D1F0668
MSKLGINIDLIGKYLAGEASPEEAMAIDHWRIGSADALKTFDEIAAVWYKINNEPVYSSIESSIAWEEFGQKIIILKKTTKTRKLFYRFSIAASIFLIAAMTVTTLFINHKKHRNIISDNGENIVVTKDSSLLRLPDNSTVTLKRGSSFKYKKSTFSSKRDVILQGDAAFNVTHIKGVPFTVTTNEVGIKVVGTIFNVSNYDGKVAVLVKRGVVLVYHQKDTLVVKVGSSVLFDKQTDKLVFLKHNTSTNRATLIFNDAPMSEVKKELETAYQINIVFNNSLLNQCRLSTRFHNESLKNVLDIIAASLDIQYKQENNTIYFYGHACN